MRCKNCHTLLKNSVQYCHVCGAQVIKNRLTLKNLLEYFTETYFNYDNKFLQTVNHLIVKPEVVISGYIEGVRKKYINPVSFLAISFTLSGFYLFFFQDNLMENMNVSSFSKYQGQEKLSQALASIAFDYSSMIYFFIIPAFAFISWIVFINQKYNFTEHIIIYLYTMSFSSVVSIVFTVFIIMLVPKSYMTYSFIIYILMLFYHIYLLKRLFQLSVKTMLIKTLLFMPLFIVFYVIASMVLVIMVLITGQLSLQDFMPTS